METDTVQLTVTDLDEIRRIIDLACTRGAFRGSEVRRVGEIYDRLDLFIQAIIDTASKEQTRGDLDD